MNNISLSVKTGRKHLVNLLETPPRQLLQAAQQGWFLSLVLVMSELTLYTYALKSPKYFTALCPYFVPSRGIEKGTSAFSCHRKNKARYRPSQPRRDRITSVRLGLSGSCKDTGRGPGCRRRRGFAEPQLGPDDTAKLSANAESERARQGAPRCCWRLSSPLPALLSLIKPKQRTDETITKTGS